MPITNISRVIATVLITGGAMLTGSCGDVVRTGRSPGFIIINSIEAASGATPAAFGTILFSDVETLVSRTIGGQQVRVPTVFSDPARASFSVAMRDPTNPNAPTPINSITLTRYRVQFIRADGRNTPGVDVPHGFDGAFTVTIPANGDASAGFDIVRHTMKQEPPLANLRGSGGLNQIATIALITFYGQDQAGNEVSAAGQMTVHFADFGDPAQ